MRSRSFRDLRNDLVASKDGFGLDIVRLDVGGVQVNLCCGS